MKNNLYLIGLMGSGKTTVGKQLAKVLSREFMDCDQFLEERMGTTIAHIFAIEGETGFREREKKLMPEISRKHNKVISTGGGVVLDIDNMVLMRQSGTVIFLRAHFGLLWNRLKGCRRRPLLQSDDPQTTLKNLLHLRNPMYMEAAHIVVDVVAESSYKTANRVRQKILEYPDIVV